MEEEEEYDGPEPEFTPLDYGVAKEFTETKSAEKLLSGASVAAAESEKQPEIKEISAEPEELPSASDSTAESNTEPSESAVEHWDAVSSGSEVDGPAEDDGSEFVVVDEEGNLEESDSTHEGEGGEIRTELAEKHASVEADAATKSDEQDGAEVVACAAKSKTVVEGGNADEKYGEEIVGSGESSAEDPASGSATESQ